MVATLYPLLLISGINFSISVVLPTLDRPTMEIVGITIAIPPFFKYYASISRSSQGRANPTSAFSERNMVFKENVSIHSG
jgi:hypothetical protein